MTDTLKVGDTGTVSRGTHRGKQAEIIGEDVTNDSYALKFADGSFGITPRKNLKAPEEPTVGLRALIAAFSDLGMIDDDSIDVRSVLRALESVHPGISQHITLRYPTEAQ